MRWLYLSITLLVYSCLNPQLLADDPPKPLIVEGEIETEPDFIYLSGGGKQRSNIDRVIAATPPEISAAVEDWTGISEHGTEVTVVLPHYLHNATFKALSAGDAFAARGSIGIDGKTVSEHDTHVTYEQVLAASDETTFYVVGVYEFEDRIADRQCAVLCQIAGRKPAGDDPDDPVIHPTGTAKWIGPIVDASSPLFPKELTDEDQVKPTVTETPLSAYNVKKIAGNPREFTDTEVLEMLGPPDLVEKGGHHAAGYSQMSWKDRVRIELVFDDHGLIEARGKFSPRISSQHINYDTFTKLRMGMTTSDVHQFFLGYRPEVEKNPDDGTTTVAYEEYIRFYVFIEDGKAQTAQRVEYVND